MSRLLAAVAIVAMYPVAGAVAGGAAFAGLALGACASVEHAVYGPANTPDPCPVRCAATNLCCEYDETCVSKFGGNYCTPPESTFGASRDGGPPARFRPAHEQFAPRGVTQ